MGRGQPPINNPPIGIHANGDIGIDISLRVFERLQKEKYRKDQQ